MAHNKQTGAKKKRKRIVQIRRALRGPVAADWRLVLELAELEDVKVKEIERRLKAGEI